jgi:hypothetical protein
MDTVLLHLDTDPHPSVFDRVVAVDSGVQHLFSYGGVTPETVMPLVHGCIFTRGPKDLHHTAIFVGGSDVAAGEAVLAAVRKHLLPQFGLSVSVMLDSNGANTTAVAAVLAAAKHLDLSRCRSLVLGGTGPVGLRVARLLAKRGGHVRIGSRQLDRAERAAATIRTAVPGSAVEAVSVGSSSAEPIADRELVVAAGAPGAVLLPRAVREKCAGLKVLIDLNGVPPAGIEGVDPADKGALKDGGLVCYGAIGVGGTKMKVHKAALAELFTRTDLTLDVDEIDRHAQRV